VFCIIKSNGFYDKKVGTHLCISKTKYLRLVWWESIRRAIQIFCGLQDKQKML